MSDQETPPTPETPAPPPPPAAAPPPTPPPATAPSAAGGSGNRGLMIALAYLWILAIVPLIVEKDDNDIQWHAKHGLVLLGLEIITYIVLGVVSMIPVLGCFLSLGFMIVPLVFLVLRILCIVKALNNERFMVPGVSELTEKF